MMQIGFKNFLLLEKCSRHILFTTSNLESVSYLFQDALVLSLGNGTRRTQPRHQGWGTLLSLRNVIL